MSIIRGTASYIYVDVLEPVDFLFVLFGLRSKAFKTVAHQVENTSLNQGRDFCQFIPVPVGIPNHPISFTLKPIRSVGVGVGA